MDASVPFLHLQNVTVHRGDGERRRPALDHVSLRIATGENVCILGPNGCGKSTLIRLITRDSYPEASPGSAMQILGRNRWNVFELRSLLGIVSPDLIASCSTESSGRDVVLSGFFSSTRIFPHQHPLPEQLEKVDALLVRLGLSHLGNRPLTQMSSGEVKRMMIARALIHDPQALLLDEPSNALDITAQEQLRKTMSQLAGEGVTILLVTHHVSEIIPEITRVILMREGKIVADGAKHEILQSRKLSELFGIAIQVVEKNGIFQLI